LASVSREFERLASVRAFGECFTRFECILLKPTIIDTREIKVVF
jgi:hypothetical protein